LFILSKRFHPGLPHSATTVSSHHQAGGMSMEDQLKVLEIINKNVQVNQKSIGQLCHFSAGKVNYLIRD
jgi:hypothetical protein